MAEMEAIKQKRMAELSQQYGVRAPQAVVVRRTAL